MYSLSGKKNQDLGDSGGSKFPCQQLGLGLQLLHWTEWVTLKLLKASPRGQAVRWCDRLSFVFSSKATRRQASGSLRNPPCSSSQKVFVRVPKGGPQSCIVGFQLHLQGHNPDPLTPHLRGFAAHPSLSISLLLVFPAPPPFQNIPTTPTSFYSKTAHRSVSHCLQNRVLMLTFRLSLIRMGHGLTTGTQYMPTSLQYGNPERGWDEDSLHRLACYVLCVMLYICGLLLSSWLACNIKPPPLHRCGYGS